MIIVCVGIAMFNGVGGGDADRDRDGPSETGDRVGEVFLLLLLDAGEK
jgi:hypothetical protein